VLLTGPGRNRSTLTIRGPLANAPHCEFASETDAAVLKVLLKVRDRDGYWWVECNACDSAWQVPYYAESVG
jgi:hypothetical protein